MMCSRVALISRSPFTTAANQLFGGGALATIANQVVGGGAPLLLSTMASTRPSTTTMWMVSRRNFVALFLSSSATSTNTSAYYRCRGIHNTATSSSWMRKYEDYLEANYPRLYSLHRLLVDGRCVLFLVWAEKG